MNYFKVGDTVYFFITDCGRYSWGEDVTVIHPQHLTLIKGLIVDMNENQDSVHVYVKGEQMVCTLGYTFHHENLFNTIDDATDSLIRRAEILSNEMHCKEP